MTHARWKSRLLTPVRPRVTNPTRRTRRTGDAPRRRVSTSTSSSNGACPLTLPGHPAAAASPSTSRSSSSSLSSVNRYAPAPCTATVVHPRVPGEHPSAMAAERHERRDHVDAQRLPRRRRPARHRRRRRFCIDSSPLLLFVPCRTCAVCTQGVR
ncbi:hypothetical protein DAI22_03g211900 [Oryza sativa Japonica Group]|nr:hypothetical protein DAI22_03g211900 [Oryza sativa Japonica Group]